MIDVLYLIGTLGIGGTERHLSIVLPELVRRGWRIEVALLAEDGPFGEPLRNSGVGITRLGTGPIMRIPKLSGLLHLHSMVQTLSKRLLTDPPKLLHCFLPTSCIVGGWAARAASFAPVAMSRRSQAIRPALFPGDKLLERSALRRADLVFAHSRAVLSELERDGVAPEHLRLVHNGIALAPPLTAAERKSTRAEEGWRDDEVIVIAVANLIQYKGHSDLLHGLAGAAANGLSGWRLVLVGDGSAQYLADLRALVKELEISDRVSFLGRRMDVSRVLAGADIGVLASHHEGFSNAVLEYMSAGLPVVVTATGGNLDAVEDGTTGILVPVAAPDAIGRALSQLILDTGSRNRMGTAGRLKVAREFSLDACVTQYEGAYLSLSVTHDRAA